MGYRDGELWRQRDALLLMQRHRSIQMQRTSNRPSFGWAALAGAAIGATIAAAAPRVAAADRREGDVSLEAFVTVSPFAGFDYPADGHGPSAKGVMEYGIGGAMSRRLFRWLELGGGLRYDYGRDEPDETMHLVAATFEPALVLPIGTGSELRLELGLALGFGVLPGYGSGGALLVFGPGGELGLGFAHRIAPSGLALKLQAGVRLDMLGELNAGDGSYLNNGMLFHGQLPFVRAGLVWR